MARRRFFVDAIRGGSAELRGEDARHLTRVLRVTPGEIFEISDNRAAWTAEVVEARGEHVAFRVLEPVDTPPPPARIALYASLIKFDRFEWIVEKATELGVERIVPVEAALSEKGLLEASRKRRERWIRIAREAAQQSRRTTLPEVAESIRFEQALSAGADLHYFLEEAAAPALIASLPASRAAADRIALLLGPEGGWTDGERKAAAAHNWHPVSLGPTVLRAETAAIAALAVLTCEWDRPPGLSM